MWNNQRLIFQWWLCIYLVLWPSKSTVFVARRYISIYTICMYIVFCGFEYSIPLPITYASKSNHIFHEIDWTGNPDSLFLKRQCPVINIRVESILNRFLLQKRYAIYCMKPKIEICVQYFYGLNFNFLRNARNMYLHIFLLCVVLYVGLTY